MEPMLRLAVQKSGRLSEGSMKLIKECGVSVSNGIGKLKATASNFPIEFLFLRDDDIPGYVADGIADIGIVGENEVAEKQKDVSIRHRLGFSKCRLSIAIPKSETYNGVQDLEGKSIATSYPNILEDYLSENNIKTDIHEISGSVEIAPSIGLAEAICDLVSSGSTLFTNGLKEAEVIFRSEAVMIAPPTLSPEKEDLFQKLLFRIKSVQKAKNFKYILLNTPREAVDKIISILPGMRSPTLVPLATEGWVSMHSVIDENDFWDKIEELKAAGAEGILVVPIEKMIL
ncbi:ATP phosphoribosyltransferase [Flammeovirgaceae bacterium SG7u.111]|nr:ATP phosphoribosyltransferase [Flammeovirgaceae bacterium SG7u.132]WPO36847.1 ATP phosphoribosyltransferase [Flammeovirgaceae bacterium SG7u.111]